MNFEQWLIEMYKKSNGSPLSKRSIKHYTGGILTISHNMIEQKVIDKPITEMDLVELDLSISIILNTKTFQDQDKKGKGMYSNSLKRYRCFLFYSTDLYQREIEEISKLEKDTDLSKTEKEMLIKARRGQGKFRDLLKEKYNNSCIVTGTDIGQVLVASHIKPWAVSNNDERLSVNNGLLLSATYDRLFDGGLITFKKDGTMLISSMINDENKEKLNLHDGFVFDIKYTPAMEKFINYHNDVIYVK